MPDTSLGARDKVVDKADKNLCPLRTYIPVGGDRP